MRATYRLAISLSVLKSIKIIDDKFNLNPQIDQTHNRNTEL